MPVEDVQFTVAQTLNDLECSDVGGDLEASVTVLMVWTGMKFLTVSTEIPL